MENQNQPTCLLQCPGFVPCTVGRLCFRVVFFDIAVVDRDFVYICSSIFNYLWGLFYCAQDIDA